MHTLNLGIVAPGLAHQKCGSLSVKRVGWVRVPQQLWEEDLENIDHVEHGRPCLVDNVEADRSRPSEFQALSNPSCFAYGGLVTFLSLFLLLVCVSSSNIVVCFVSCFPNLQFIDVWVEYAVYETNAGRFVRVLIGQLDADFPNATFEWSYCLFCKKRRDREIRHKSREGENLLSAGPLNLT